MAHSARRLRLKFAAPSLSSSCLHKLRVPPEFAAGLDPGAGVREEEEDGAEQREVLVVGPLGKVWRVGLLCQQQGGGGGGWWLGSGWAELAAAHGVSEGWSVVLRRERRGVATVAAFDPGRCLARLCTPHAGLIFKNRPRFIKLLQPDDLEKMRVPDKFVQEHLTETESCPISQTAIILSPLSKFWRLELERGQSDVLFKDGWARFLMAHDLSQGNILVFRYEGNLVFSVEVFLQNGCLKEYTRAGSLILTDDPNGPRTGTPQSGKELVVATASKKRKYRKRVVSPNSANKVGSQCKLANTVRRPSFKKQINRYSLKSFLAVKGTFCSSIGLVSACTIKLQTSMDSTRSWSVPFNTANTYGYITGPRWKRFCRDNKLKEGDLCTFNIVKTTVWHVVIN